MFHVPGFVNAHCNSLYYLFIYLLTYFLFDWRKTPVLYSRIKDDLRRVGYDYGFMWTMCKEMELNNVLFYWKSKISSFVGRQLQDFQQN